MPTEKFKDGSVTYSMPTVVVDMAERWLMEYFIAATEPKRPGDLEDELCGARSLAEVMIQPQEAWRRSCFFPALGRLIDRKQVCYWRRANGDIVYADVAKLFAKEENA